MPYDIKEENGKFCVYPKGADKPAATFDNRAEAEAWMKKAMQDKGSGMMNQPKSFDLETWVSSAVIGIGGNLKTLADGWVEGPAVLFGDKSQSDLVGQWFTETTNFDWEGKETRPAIYHHGLDQELGTRRFGVNGKGWEFSRKDHVALWVKHQLDLRDEYEKYVYALAGAGKMGLSSGTAKHLIKALNSGEITEWPIAEISYTPTPCEPRTAVSPIKSLITLPLKAFFESDSAEAALSTEPSQNREGERTGKSNPLSTPLVASPVPVGTHAGAMKGTPMYTIDNLKALVPGLSDEQYKAIAAVMSLSTPTPAAPVAPEANEKAADKQVLLDALKELGFELPATKSAPARPPYNFTPAKETPEADDGHKKSVNAAHFLRFGDVEPAIKAVSRDLYGSDYEDLRLTQHKAFGKFLRSGESNLNGDERKSLKTVVLTPAQMKAFVTSGVEVSAMKTDLSEAIDELGGYLVPEDVRTDMIERLPGLTVVRPRADVATTNSDVMSRIKVTGGDNRHIGPVRVTYVGDKPVKNGAVTNPTFGVEKSPVHIAKATVRTPLALLEDSAYPLTAKVSEWVSIEYALDEDEQFLIGNGIAKPEGILPGGLNPNTRLTEVKSGAAADLTSMDGLVDLVYSVARQYRGSAVFVMADATAAKTAKIKDLEGRYQWEPSRQAGEPAMLMGYPVLTDEAMPAVAANKYAILFGDFRAYSIVDRIGMSVTRDDITEVEEDIVKFVFRRRFGGQLTREWAFATMKIAA